MRKMNKWRKFCMSNAKIHVIHAENAKFQININERKYLILYTLIASICQIRLYHRILADTRIFYSLLPYSK